MQLVDTVGQALNLLEINLKSYRVFKLQTLRYGDKSVLAGSSLHVSVLQYRLFSVIDCMFVLFESVIIVLVPMLLVIFS